MAGVLRKGSKRDAEDSNDEESGSEASDSEESPVEEKKVNVKSVKPVKGRINKTVDRDMVSKGGMRQMTDNTPFHKKPSKYYK